jgi:predicted secreted protein
MSLRFIVALVSAAALAGCAQPTGNNDQDGGGANSGRIPPEVTLSAPWTVENGAAVKITLTVTDPDDTAHAFEWMVDGALAGYGPGFVFTQSWGWGDPHSDGLGFRRRSRGHGKL